jgi:hypothetical protein
MVGSANAVLLFAWPGVALRGHCGIRRCCWSVLCPWLSHHSRPLTKGAGSDPTTSNRGTDHCCREVPVPSSNGLVGTYCLALPVDSLDVVRLTHSGGSQQTTRGPALAEPTIGLHLPTQGRLFLVSISTAFACHQCRTVADRAEPGRVLRQPQYLYRGTGCCVWHSRALTRPDSNWLCTDWPGRRWHVAAGVPRPDNWPDSSGQESQDYGGNKEHSQGDRRRETSTSVSGTAAL